MKNFLNLKIIIAIVIDFILSGLAINFSNYIRLSFFEIIKVEMRSIGLIRNIISPCYHQNLNLFKWQVRRNNPIEFQ